MIIITSESKKDIKEQIKRVLNESSSVQATTVAESLSEEIMDGLQPTIIEDIDHEDEHVIQTLLKVFGKAGYSFRIIQV